MLLAGWGLVSIDRLTPAFADRQTIWLIIAVIALLTVATLPHPLRWLRNYRYLWLLLGLLLLGATIVFGTNPSGTAGSPQLWLGFGNIFFQPSEALKILLVVFLASYLGEEYPLIRAENTLGETSAFALSPRVLGPVFLMFGLTLITLVWQRDLGTATLFFLVFIVLMYAASGNLFVFVGGGILLAIVSVIAYSLFGVVQLRVDIWINPWLEADGNAFQIIQSLQAVAAGGIFGQGIGQGAPYYIPVVHSDFIFAAIAEEWGLLGITSLIISILTISWSGLRSAVQQSNAFYSLLSIGLSTLIALQSILIIGGVIRFVPLTGVTLPFVSYGGSSLLMSFIIVGLLIRLSVKDG